MRKGGGERKDIRSDTDGQVDYRLTQPRITSFLPNLSLTATAISHTEIREQPMIWAGSLALPATTDGISQVEQKEIIAL